MSETVRIDKRSADTCSWPSDPAVTLRVYSHVLREHAQGVGDVFAQAIKASVSKSVSSRDANS